MPRFVAKRRIATTHQRRCEGDPDRIVPGPRARAESHHGWNVDSARESGLIIGMSMTLDIDGGLMALARRSMRAESNSRIVELALRSWIEQASRKRPAALHGAVPKARAPERRRIRRRSA